MHTSKQSIPFLKKEGTLTDPIRLGLVGLNFGEHIAYRIAENVDCLKIVAVCDLDKQRLDRAAAGLGVTSYEDLDAMLEDPAIEAVALFTGSVGRAKIISKILNANRHVLTTKPFELDLSGAEKVLREALERNLVVQLNSPAPELPQDSSTIYSWIKEYNLGRPLAFHARTWANYREKPNGTWYDDPNQCAAAPILRLGVYFLNEFATFMGKPRSVHVVQSRIFTERPTADNAHMTIEFENGAIGSIFSSFCIEDGLPWRDEITLNFEGGTVNRWVERLNGSDMSQDYAVTELLRKGAKTVRAQTEPGGFAGWYQWESFWQAIRKGNGMTEKYVGEILYGVRLIEAMQRSAKNGQPELVR